MFIFARQSNLTRSAQLGNPMGGMVYSNQYPTGNTDNSSLTQVIEWNEYVSSLPLPTLV